MYPLAKHMSSLHCRSALELARRNLDESQFPFSPAQAGQSRPLPLSVECIPGGRALIPWSHPIVNFRLEGLPEPHRHVATISLGCRVTKPRPPTSRPRLRSSFFGQYGPVNKAGDPPTERPVPLDVISALPPIFGFHVRDIHLLFFLQLLWSEAINISTHET